MDDSFSDTGEFQPVYQKDDFTIASESSVVSDISPARKKQRNYLDAYKLNDKLYHKIVRNGGNKQEKVGLYSTNITPGASIRDAITGLTDDTCRVGTIYEDLFFKVVFATGEFGSDPKTAFFDCPEHYERHLNASVSQQNKDNWTNKFVAARKRLNMDQQ